MYPLFVLISAAPHDMCPFLVLISAAPHDMYPFWFLFRLRLMICALFGSFLSCASWYVPFFGSYFGCASWYVPFFVLISAAPHNMRLFFVLITSQRICDLLLRTHGDMGCVCLTEWIQSSSQIEANYWPPQFSVPRALWVEQLATDANASYLISKSHLRKKDLFFCPSRQRWYICNKKDKGSTYWCRWLNFKGKCPSS